MQLNIFKKIKKIKTILTKNYYIIEKYFILKFQKYILYLKLNKIAIKFKLFFLSINSHLAINCYIYKLI